MNYLNYKDPPLYESLLVQNKFELSYYSYSHRKNGKLPQLIFPTQDPTFVRALNKSIPLPMYPENDLTFAVELAEILKNAETLPDYAIFEEFPWDDKPYFFQIFKKEFIDKYFEHEKSFYFTNKFTVDTNNKYLITDNAVERYLFKKKEKKL